jgi:aminomethyltransferase
VVTSGNFSPVLERGIAMAFLDAESGVANGDEVVVEVRGRPLTAHVTPLPFVHKGAGNTKGAS